MEPPKPGRDSEIGRPRKSVSASVQRAEIAGRRIAPELLLCEKVLGSELISFTRFSLFCLTRILYTLFIYSGMPNCSNVRRTRVTVMSTVNQSARRSIVACADTMDFRQSLFLLCHQCTHQKSA